MKQSIWKYIFCLLAMFSLFSCSKDKEVNETKPVPESLKGSNYHLLIMDPVTREKIKDQIAKDYRPNKEAHLVFVWGDSYTPSLCTTKNFYDELQGWRSYIVGTNGWSAVAFYNTDATGIDMTALDDSYVFHIAIKSKDNATHAVRFLGSDGKLTGFGLGTQPLEGTEPFADFERNGEWQEIEVPVKYLFDKGLRYDNKIPQGDMAIFYSGGVTGTSLDIDAAFFYKKSN